MTKDKSEKICFICFLIASIGYFIVSIMNFIEEKNSTAIIFLCLGAAFLALSFTHLGKDKSKDD